MSKTILVLAIVTALIIGVLAANPAVEAAAGWKAAVEDLLAQITSNDADIADHETRIVTLEGQTPTDDDTLRDLGCSEKQIPIFDENMWKCGERTVAGDFDGDGNSDIPVCSAGEILEADGSGGYLCVIVEDDLLVLRYQGISVHDTFRSLGQQMAGIDGQLTNFIFWFDVGTADVPPIPVRATVFVNNSPTSLTCDVLAVKNTIVTCMADTLVPVSSTDLISVGHQFIPGGPIVNQIGDSIHATIRLNQ